MVRTLRHAKLAGRAAVIEVLDALRAEWGDELSALRADLGQDLCETTVPLRDFLGLQCGCADGQCSTSHERAAAGVGPFVLCNLCRSFSLAALAPCEAVVKRIELAIVYAVEAGHAEAVIHLVI